VKIEIEDGVFLDLKDELLHNERIEIDGKKYVAQIGMDPKTKDIHIDLLNLSSPSNSPLRKLLELGSVKLRRNPPTSKDPYYSKGFNFKD
jgi:hypothetical protein